jgi:hypothetical protein
MDNLYFIGDHHNEWEDFKTEILTKGIRDAAIIQLGDAGFGCYPRKIYYDYLVKQNQFLKDRNIVLYNIRGNHDNPNWFQPKAKMVAFFRNEDKQVPSWMKEDIHYIVDYMSPQEYADAITKLTNIKFVPDYTVLELAGHKILCIGGAISIDRMFRKEGRNYFKNEVLVHLPDKLKKIKGVDIVATHTVPDFIPPLKQDAPIVKQFIKHDKHLIADLVEERQTMTKIYHDIVANNTVNHWLYGHFHRWNNTYYKDTQFMCLPANKTFKMDY